MIVSTAIVAVVVRIDVVVSEQDDSLINMLIGRTVLRTVIIPIIVIRIRRRQRGGVVSFVVLHQHPTIGSRAALILADILLSKTTPS